MEAPANVRGLQQRGMQQLDSAAATAQAMAAYSAQPGQNKQCAAVYERLGNACKEQQRLELSNQTASPERKEVCPITHHPHPAAMTTRHLLPTSPQPSSTTPPAPSPQPRCNSCRRGLLMTTGALLTMSIHQVHLLPPNGCQTADRRIWSPGSPGSPGPPPGLLRGDRHGRRRDARPRRDRAAGRQA